MHLSEVSCLINHQTNIESEVPKTKNLIQSRCINTDKKRRDLNRKNGFLNVIHTSNKLEAL
ncbi:hypothetical protein BpHYR1_040659 [Brachionus plicatilis]|uniref:Uncharacterized protein n=1 Tax=Brachionus plicatilis TaxID=10195 RepID=A0A3M7RNC8_BRAPC|nr:hypothetical protein BpHYR1_040659 [Brachionus plicatilis]